MNLLFVLNIGFDKTGPSVHLLKDIIRSSLERGHRCQVILKKDACSKETGLEELSDEYKSLTITLIRENSKKNRSFIRRYLADCIYALKCRKYYRKNKYDAIFLQSCNVGLIHIKGLQMLKCPVIFNIQDIFPQNLMFSGQLPLPKFIYPIFLKLQKEAYKRVTKLITISDDMKETLVEQGISKEKIEVIYNWSYDDDSICLADIDEKHIYDLKTDPNKFNIVYAGNIGKMQNVELIAKTAAFSQNDDAIHYYIIGDGTNKKNIEKMLQGLSNVTILPMQPQVYAESIYAQADVNVIPLVNSGIRTALPSKTATILRVCVPVVFCIDANSEFEKMMKDNARVHVADNSDPASLYRVICDLRDCRRNTIEEKNLFSIFSRKNSGRYIDVIENIVAGKSI